MTGQSYTAATTRAWVEVDLGALVRNATTLACRARAPLLPMVKADAYGLGAVAVARALEPLRPWGYGVATVAEGAELRSAGIERPIMVFTPLLRADWPALREAALTPALDRPGDIMAWSELGGAWHLAVDTGMNRSGVPWHQVAALAPALRAAPPEGVFTHFHSADRNDGTMELQEERFRAALAELPARPALVHAENSAGLEHHPGRSTYDLARPGVFLYGVDPMGTEQVAPVVAMRARVVELRDVADGETVSYAATWRAAGRRRIATLAVGYADGYRRALSNRGVVLIRRRRAPVAGMVTMDMTMVDVTGIPCELGDVATLIGSDGVEQLTLPEVARMADLSPYELLTGLRGRLPRLYQDAGTGRAHECPPEERT